MLMSPATLSLPCMKAICPLSCVLMMSRKQVLGTLSASLCPQSQQRPVSCIRKQPAASPYGVKIQLADGKVRVEGPKGKLEIQVHRNMKVEQDAGGKALLVKRPDDERLNRALHGL